LSSAVCETAEMAVWQFLLQLLEDGEECIEWKGKDGTFRLNEFQEVLRRWRLVSENPDTTKNSFSRMLRKQYGKEFLIEVPGHFTYKFHQEKPYIKTESLLRYVRGCATRVGTNSLATAEVFLFVHF